MELQFSLIRNDLIFKDTFDELDEENGKIVFKHKNNGKGGIAVIYAPNGVGKSSFAKVLGSNEASESIDFRATDEKGKEYTPESSAFHVIEDQIQRNIIKGDESQYLVGKDIKREYELKKRVGEGFANTFKGSLPDTFKKKYKVTKIKDDLLKRLQIVGGQSYRYILSIVNKSQRGSNIDRTEFVSFIENPSNRSSIDTLIAYWLVLIIMTLVLVIILYAVPMGIVFGGGYCYIKSKKFDKYAQWIMIASGIAVIAISSECVGFRLPVNVIILWMLIQTAFPVIRYIIIPCVVTLYQNYRELPYDRQREICDNMITVVIGMATIIFILWAFTSCVNDISEIFS